MEKLKVFILHPSHDYGVEGVFLTRKGAEDRLQKINEEACAEWELYKKTDRYKPDLHKENFFMDRFYIHEIEVQE